MALYITIDESYSVTKLTSLKAVVQACKGYYTRDGQAITLAVVKQELKAGSFNAYAYDDEELEDARENGSVIGVDWQFKIQSI